MMEDLLECAERLRCEGDSERAISTLRLVLERTTADIKRMKQPRKEALQTRAMRAVAAYQLAVLELQRGQWEAGDDLLWRLGFKARLADSIMAYEQVQVSGNRKCRAWHVDDALGEADFEGLKRLFGAGAAYWTEHEYPTTEFFSHNVPLNGKDELTMILRRVRALVALSHPEVGDATSVEIWAHAREADGHHQLHYDLDENLLRSSGRCRSPMASSVLYLQTTHGTSGGAPTLVVDREISEDDHDLEKDGGWLCSPRVNRLLSFDGNLLHCVVPTVAQNKGKKRITLMLGWWCEVQTGKEGGLGPNAPLDAKAKWLQGASAPKKKKKNPASLTPNECASVGAVWKNVVKGDKAKFGELSCEDVAFTGRFFLREESAQEIDEAVLSKPPAIVEAPPEFVSIEEILRQQQQQQAPAEKNDEEEDEEEDEDEVDAHLQKSCSSSKKRLRTIMRNRRLLKGRKKEHPG